MLIIKDGFAVLGTSRIEEYTVQLEQLEVFRHARIELHETIVVEDGYGGRKDVAYLTVTIPLQDDRARKSAYRLQDQARSSGSGTGEGAGDEIHPHPAVGGSDERNGDAPAHSG